MAELTASVVLNLKGNLARKARRDAEALEAVGKRGGKAMSALSRTSNAASASIRRLGGRFTALVAGVSAVAAGRDIINFDARLASIGARAGNTGKDLDKFVKDTKKRFFDLAKLPEFNLNPDQVLEAVDEIVTKTGDIDLALRQLPNIALLIRGGEASGRDAGALIAELDQKFKIKTVKEMTAALGDLTAQGDKGAFEIKNMAENSERLAAKFSILGRTGRGAIREMGAVLQMFKTTAGSPEMTVTAAERFIDTITSEKAGELRKAGIRLFERDRQGRHTDKFRFSSDILKDIILKAEQIATERDVSINEVLGKVFDIRAFRGVTAFTLQFQAAKRAGKLEDAFKKATSFLSPSDGEALLLQRSKDLSRRAKAKVERGKTGFREAADKLIGPAIDKAVEVFNIEGAPIPLKDRMPVGGTETILNRFRRRRAGLPLPTTPAEEAVGAVKEFFVNDFRRLGIDLAGAKPVEGKIIVEFENAPPGTSVRTIESRGIELEVDTGFMMEGE